MFLKDRSFYIGFFLAVRDIKRSNIWTTILIIGVMGLTFCNMILMGGILVGITQGAIKSSKDYYSGNVLITPVTSKSVIEQTLIIDQVAKSLPSFKALSNRYTAQALIEYDYQNKIRPTDLPESTTGTVEGIDPTAEDRASHLSKAIIAGSFLQPNDIDKIVIGSSLIKKYTTVRGSALAIGNRILKKADVGSRVRLTINGIQKEVWIKGVITTNSTTIDGRIFMVDSSLQKFTGNTNLNANEITIYLQDNSSDNEAKNYILKNFPHHENIIVETGEEAIPSSITSIVDTFTMLGNIVGVIALIVGAVTIFIVIFVNAVTRRKFIGILKGIGISPRAIETSYIFQAIFYALFGIFWASILVIGFIEPYFDLHPIKYPIAPGSLAITMTDVLVRATILMVTALISGFIPAWIVTRQNTLDSILGR